MQETREARHLAGDPSEGRSDSLGRDDNGNAVASAIVIVPSGYSGGFEQLFEAPAALLQPDEAQIEIDDCTPDNVK